MIEIDDNNPPQEFEFTQKELFLVLSNIGAINVNDYLLESWFKSMLNNSLKGQVGVKIQNGKVKVTLYQPTEEDKKLLGK